jgi:hypothetical protein
MMSSLVGLVMIATRGLIEVKSEVGTVTPSRSGWSWVSVQ